jgi:MerR family redox-sensitive transcriptional activator SoxR
MIISELAQSAGVAASTIRYYEELGLLPKPRRTSGRRAYDDDARDRLCVITFAKEAGFSLREIRQLFHGFGSTTPARARWQKLATAKRSELEALSARIETMKALLAEALRCGCLDLEVCGQMLRKRAMPSQCAD